MKLSRRPLASVFGLSLLAMAINAFSADETAPATAPGTLTVKGENPSVDQNGHASFSVRMAWDTIFVYPTAKKLAVIFDSAATNDNTLQCPVLKLGKRVLSIEEVQPNVLKIETDVTPAEHESIDKARCAVVDQVPPLSKIKFLPRNLTL